MAAKKRVDDDVIKTIEDLCSNREILVTTGSGGVGKTTTAASIGAVAAANLGAKVLVLTVDPARRLATALGLQEFGNVETKIPDSAWKTTGMKPRGELWAAMLDTKQSWDDLIHRHAPDEETRDAILSNSLYQNITGRFVQSHDYIAMERLYEIHTSGRYDLIVVDTPPTRNAIDFLDAPDRMSEFFSSRLLRWLIAPYSSRAFSIASKPFYAVADRVLGTQFLQDIAEFFILFQTMYDGFVERADAVTALLGDRRSSFIVVSTLEVSPVAEAEFFIETLADRGLNLGAVVLNKALPTYFLESDPTEAARQLDDDAPRIAKELVGVVAPVTRSDTIDDNADPLAGTGTVAWTEERLERHLSHILDEVGTSFLNYQLVARRESEQRNALEKRSGLCVVVPYFEQDIASLDGLIQLGEIIWT